jgi:hypothetical protein
MGLAWCGLALKGHAPSFEAVPAFLAPTLACMAMFAKRTRPHNVIAAASEAGVEFILACLHTNYMLLSFGAVKLWGRLRNHHRR